MEMVTTFTTLVNTIGFPIAVCIALFWFLYQENKSHKEETKRMTEAIDNNTAVMNKMLDKITNHRDDM